MGESRATGVVVVRDAVTMHGTAVGTGPTVLLLHAGGERRTVWTPVATALADAGLRTVAFDLRGHGESSGRASCLQEVADDVTAMILRETAPLVVVGASLGGLAALAALTDTGVARRVDGLVLVDVVPGPDPVRTRAWLDERGLRAPHHDLVEDMLRRGPDLRAAAAAIDVPMLLVRGGDRSPLADDDVARFRASVPTLAIREFPAAGHLVAREAPHDLAAVLVEHAWRWLAPGAAGTPLGPAPRAADPG